MDIPDIPSEMASTAWSVAGSVLGLERHAGGRYVARDGEIGASEGGLVARPSEAASPRSPRCLRGMSVTPSEMARSVPLRVGLRAGMSVTLSELARSVRSRVGSCAGDVGYIGRVGEIGAVEGGVVRARARLRALGAKGRPRNGARDHPIKGDVGGEKARPVAWEEVSRVRRVEMASPRRPWWHRVLGAVTGEMWLFWGDTCRIGEGRRPERA